MMTSSEKFQKQQSHRYGGEQWTVTRRDITVLSPSDDFPSLGERLRRWGSGILEKMGIFGQNLRFGRIPLIFVNPLPFYGVTPGPRNFIFLGPVHLSLGSLEFSTQPAWHVLRKEALIYRFYEGKKGSETDLFKEGRSGFPARIREKDPWQNSESERVYRFLREGYDKASTPSLTVFISNRWDQGFSPLRDGFLSRVRIHPLSSEGVVFRLPEKLRIHRTILSSSSPIGDGPSLKPAPIAGDSRRKKIWEEPMHGPVRAERKEGAGARIRFSLSRLPLTSKVFAQREISRPPREIRTTVSERQGSIPEAVFVNFGKTASGERRSLLPFLGPQGGRRAAFSKKWSLSETILTERELSENPLGGKNLWTVFRLERGSSLKTQAASVNVRPSLTYAVPFPGPQDSRARPSRGRTIDEADGMALRQGEDVSKKVEAVVNQSIRKWQEKNLEPDRIARKAYQMMMKRLIREKERLGR